MTTTPPHAIPLRPNLEQYKKQAKELLTAYQAGEPGAVSRIHAERSRDDGPRLADAQLTIAREHGLPSWPRFKQRIEAVQELGEALRNGGNAKRVKALVGEHPEIVHSRPWPQWEDASPAQIAAGMSVWHRPQMREIAELLFEHGAEPTIHLAARTGLLDRVTAALDEDPELLNAHDGRGATPLYYAACVYGAHKEAQTVADLLIERGAEIDIFVAATCVMPNRVAALLSENPALATAKDPFGMTALHWTVRPRPYRWCDQSSIDITRRLLEAGAEIAVPNPSEDGMQPIHHACEWSVCNDNIALLLDADAEVNARADNGWTPLDYAIDRSRMETAEFLKGRGGVTSEG